MLKVDNVPADSTIHSLKDHFAQFGQVVFVDHTGGETSARVRFEAEFTEMDQAKEAKIGETTLELSMVTGDENKAFWTTAMRSKLEKKIRSRNEVRDGGRGGGRGRGRGRGRHREFGSHRRVLEQARAAPRTLR